ncbi:MAG: hypothetical protein CMI31_08370 [Opitutae bacterium]|nr:hypothetical protein [Opitutae bacterium]
MLRLIGRLFLLGSLLGALGEWLEIEFPTVRFPFTLSREIGFLHFDLEGGGVFPWFGWLVTILFLVLGFFTERMFVKGFSFTPITLRRIERFKSIKRGYYSLIVIFVLATVASLDHLLVGHEALFVKYDGNWHWPAFSRATEKGKVFGLQGDDGESPPNYRDLQRQFAGREGDDWVMMPLLPYAPTGDTITAVSTKLKVSQDGFAKVGGQPFSGLAAKVYELTQPERMHLRFRFRDGRKDGPVDGWDEKRNRIYGADYSKGKLVVGSESWNGKGELKTFLDQNSSGLRQVHFPPSPPTFEDGQTHILGTSSKGYDVLAYLFGGLQVNFKAALVYIPLVYALGISIGLLMGFFGGAFDLIIQRLIEILSNIPFLFVVMIASTAIPEGLKETAGLWIIIAILLLFGWMGMTYLMRTAALKEKARDYIAASRVIGASTPRILFRHLLPNSIAIIVTLVPFSISSLVLALTSLDYLGFGLPAKYATWGQLLRDGLDNLSSPWLVTSAFLVLVGLLILITFVGEAVREAFDPKKFSYYR